MLGPLLGCFVAILADEVAATITAFKITELDDACRRRHWLLVSLAEMMETKAMAFSRIHRRANALSLSLSLLRSHLLLQS
jgi:hypothetical protein